MKSSKLALLLLASMAVATASSAQVVTFKASDGQKVFAQLYSANKKSKGIILMFHQAGSNRSEYSPIATQVIKLGFDCLAVDQRSGGNMWNATNQTAAQYRQVNNYLSAYQDMEGALDWAKSRNYPKIIAWGSSYSASLVLRLMSEHPEIAAGLVFSPGEYFDQKDLVASWNRKVKSPVLFAFSKSEALNGGLKLYQSAGKSPRRSRDTMLANKEGIHGSSTLRQDRNPKGNSTYWTGVETFLRAVGK